MMFLNTVKKMQRQTSCLSWDGCTTCGGLGYRMNRFRKAVEEMVEINPEMVLSELLRQKMRSFADLRWFPSPRGNDRKCAYETERQRTLEKFGIPEWGFILWWASRGVAKAKQEFRSSLIDEVFQDLIEADSSETNSFRAAMCSILTMEPKVSEEMWEITVTRFFSLEESQGSAEMLWEYLARFRRSCAAEPQDRREWREYGISSPRMETFVLELFERTLVRTHPDRQIDTIVKLLGLGIFCKEDMRQYWPAIRKQAMTSLDEKVIRTGFAQFDIEPEFWREFAKELADLALGKKNWTTVWLLLQILPMNDPIRRNLGEKSWKTVLKDADIMAGIELLRLYPADFTYAEELISMIREQGDAKAALYCYRLLPSGAALKELAWTSLMEVVIEQKNVEICLLLLKEPELNTLQQQEVLTRCLLIAEKTESVQLFERILQKTDALDRLLQTAETTKAPALFELLLKYVKLSDPRLDEIAYRCRKSGFSLAGYTAIKQRIDRNRIHREKAKDAALIQECGETPLERMRFLIKQEKFIPGLYPDIWAKIDEEPLGALSIEEKKKLLQLLEPVKKSCWVRLRHSISAHSIEALEVPEKQIES